MIGVFVASAILFIEMREDTPPFRVERNRA